MKIKKALCLASMASNLDNFNRNNVKILRELGYDVTLASNFHTAEDSNSQKKTLEFMKEMESEGIHIVQIDFSRKIGNFKGQIRSYNQVKKLLTQEYDLIHCHAPICAAITRLCAKKYRARGKTKVIYTAHGFHFYKGAPLKNWLLYYPVEWICSFWTDVQITINREDYERARKHFHAQKTVYIPGVGIDISNYITPDFNPEAKRKELGLNTNEIMVLSVGELTPRKNHEIVIKALGQLDNENIEYFICGIGELDEYLINLAKENKIRLHLLGFRTDIRDLYRAADLFILPSKQEGLSVALMEAIAAKVPVVCSRIRGNIDLIESPEYTFSTIAELQGILTKLICGEKKPREIARSQVEANFDRLGDCDKNNVNQMMKDLYSMMAG